MELPSGNRGEIFTIRHEVGCFSWVKCEKVQLLNILLQTTSIQTQQAVFLFLCSFHIFASSGLVLPDWTDKKSGLSHWGWNGKRKRKNTAFLSKPFTPRPAWIFVFRAFYWKQNFALTHNRQLIVVLTVVNPHSTLHSADGLVIPSVQYYLENLQCVQLLVIMMIITTTTTIIIIIGLYIVIAYQVLSGFIVYLSQVFVTRIMSIP